MKVPHTLLLIPFLFSWPLLAQQPPDEQEMFGSPATAKPAAERPDAFARGEATDNPLSIGGTFYQRMIVSSQKGVSTGNTPLSMPLQFDLFLDSRPNDRLRGFVDERLLYDSTRDQYSNTTNGTGLGNYQTSSTSGAPANLNGTGPANVPNNPQTALDQAWLKFDLERKVFVTVGRQHVKWGTSRFWNPTDLLSNQRRDPLLPYDLRLGTTMVKLDMPLETKKSNLYALALFDNPQPASTLGQLGGALRAETLIGKAEFGLDTIGRGGRHPVYGADLSAPLGPFDIYAEGAYQSGGPAPKYQLNSIPTAGTDLSTVYSEQTPTGPMVQVSGGANYSFAWRDNRQATIGVEYFYNQLGYTDASVYPVLIFLGQYQPFYTARNYAAIYATAEGPDAEKHTSYTFSTIGNLSDNSYITRLDFSWRALTYLTFEAYGDYHFGSQGGEFNFSLNTPALTNHGVTVAAVNVPPTVFDLGLGLRLAF